MEFLREITAVIFSIFNAMSPYLLLGFLFAGILHAFVPQRLLADYLAKNSWTSVFYATLLGIPLPLCSCGVIPTAMALYKQGASKGAVVSFLIATPQTGVDSIIATYSLMGLPFAVIRPLVAVVTSVFAGLTTHFFTATDKRTNTVSTAEELSALSFPQKLKRAFRYGFVEMMEDIGKMLFIGLLVAGLIAYFVPDNFFLLFGSNTLLTMLLVLVVAIPMYVCATGSIPIAIALMLKGMSPGTALVLLMAGPAANIASMLVIGKVLGRKTFLLYIGTLIVGAIACGLVIDNFLPPHWFDITHLAHTAHHGDHFYYFHVLCSLVLVVLFAHALWGQKAEHTEEKSANTVVFQLGGMRCNHCKANAQNAISRLKSVQEVRVDLAQQTAYVKGNPTDEEIKSAVEPLGFEFKGRKQ